MCVSVAGSQAWVGPSQLFSTASSQVFSVIYCCYSETTDDTTDKKIAEPLTAVHEWILHIKIT